MENKIGWQVWDREQGIPARHSKIHLVSDDDAYSSNPRTLCGKQVPSADTVADIGEDIGHGRCKACQKAYDKLETEEVVS